MIQYFKLNEDDILEIVSEAIAEKTGIREFTAKSQCFGTPSKDFRILVAVSDSDMKDVDLSDIDTQIDFNGDHRNAAGLTDEEMVSALERMIASKDF